MPTIVLIGSLDTKGPEYAYLKACIEEAGARALLVDWGVLGEPTCPPDIGASEVAAAGGSDIACLRFSREGSDTRAQALAVMQAGAKAVLLRLYAEGRCDGVIGAGGSGGSSVIAPTLHALPLGVPKMMISTLAATSQGEAVFDSRDTCVMNPVTDIAGLNRISRPILRNAAFAVVGMAQAGAPAAGPEQPLVAITMFGITTPGVLRVAAGLEAAGFETATFHANGAGGRAMEEMIDAGLVDGVVDYTVSELTDEFLGGAFTAGPHRLEAASRRGIPQVIVPGSIEVLNFGPRATVPDKYDRPERRLIVHNTIVSAVRTTLEEGVVLAGILCEKVNRATGPVSVMLPLQGLDKYEQPPDGPWIDAEADAAFFSAVRARLRPDILCQELPHNINDPAFADAAVVEFLRLWRGHRSPPRKEAA